MRRPIAARESGWARQVARALAHRGVRPNAVSGASVFFAAVAALCLIAVSQNGGKGTAVALFVIAALCIQLRLLCNLFDGMLAVEFDQASAVGPIYNDFPDRPSDILILVGCGYCAALPALHLLGWIAAALAVTTAYVRVLGVAVGAREYFIGPMAKPQRMAVATIACVLSALEAVVGWPPRAMIVALVVVVLGCVVTVVRRLKFISRDLNAGAGRSDKLS
jgi:phosphatidylglycerophosphate synthase